MKTHAIYLLLITALAFFCFFLYRHGVRQKEAELTRKFDSLATIYHELDSNIAIKRDSLEMLSSLLKKTEVKNARFYTKIKHYETRLKAIDTLRIANPDSIFQLLYPSPGLGSGDSEMEGRVDSTRLTPQACPRQPTDRQRQHHIRASANQQYQGKLYRRTGGHHSEQGGTASHYARTEQLIKSTGGSMEEGGHAAEAIEMDRDRCRRAGQRIFGN